MILECIYKKTWILKFIMLPSLWLTWIVLNNIHTTLHKLQSNEFGNRIYNSISWDSQECSVRLMGNISKNIRKWMKMKAFLQHEHNWGLKSKPIDGAFARNRFMVNDPLPLNINFGPRFFIQQTVVLISRNLVVWNPQIIPLNVHTVCFNRLLICHFWQST